MGVIAGRIVDEFGEPLLGANIVAMRSMFVAGKRRLTPVSDGMRVSDDGGYYRVSGLPPGRYYILASSRETWVETHNEVRERRGYAATYFPGTTSQAEARPIVVGLGNELQLGDFVVATGRLSRVSGLVIDSSGKPVDRGAVMLVRRVGATAMSTAGSASSDVNGGFEIRDIGPGEYSLSVKGKSLGSEEAETGFATVAVVDGDVDLMVRTSAGWIATGSVVDDQGRSDRIPFQRVRVLARQLDAASRSEFLPGTVIANLDAEARFRLSKLVGPVLLSADAPLGWALRAVYLGDKDVTDSPVEGMSGRHLDGLRVLLTDRPSHVDILPAKGDTSPLELTALVFAIDASRWFPGSRWVRAARADRDGKFTIRGLPAGEYSAVAVRSLEEGVWNDPEYLASLVGLVVKLVIAEGEAKQVAVPTIHSPYQ